ncbi:MAG TPA: ParB N-terminal domain-containing protein [Coriobacteriia bacterium]|nr:ParB N-terminal domain-containing protein [Coriobacteriia bacterium]
MKIDEGFRSLIPPIRDEERGLLEQSIKADGCLDPLIVWLEEDTLLDGHNRYEICQRLGVEFQVAHVSLRSREDAEDWIDAHQLGRRNLTPDQAALIRGRRYNRLKKAPGEQNSLRQSGVVDGPTSKRLAVEHGVTSRTIERDAAFARDVEIVKAVEPEIEQHIVRGDGPTRRAVHEAAAVVATNPEEARAVLSGEKAESAHSVGRKEVSHELRELEGTVVDEMFVTITRRLKSIRKKSIKRYVSELVEKLTAWGDSL